MIVKSRRWLGEGARLKTDGDISQANVGKLWDNPICLVGDIGGGTVELSKSFRVRECEIG
jgi:hypothetical protein